MSITVARMNSELKPLHLGVISAVAAVHDYAVKVFHAVTVRLVVVGIFATRHFRRLISSFFCNTRSTLEQRIIGTVAVGVAIQEQHWLAEVRRVQCDAVDDLPVSP